jgi:hypothetical protein
MRWGDRLQPPRKRKLRRHCISLKVLRRRRVRAAGQTRRAGARAPRGRPCGRRRTRRRTVAELGAAAMDADRARAHRAWGRAETIKRLSDRLIGFGPVGVGLDGVLAWVPGANLAYSLAAGGLLIVLGVQAGAAPATLLRMGLYIGANSALTDFPIVGWALDTLFPGHLLAAKALQKDIEARHGRPADAPPQRRRWRRLRPARA